MQQVSTRFADALSAEATTLALCWRIVRRDGVALGFTTHDRAIELEGLLYRAAPGISPSAISSDEGYDAHAMEIEGALSHAAITPADLHAGRYDGAQVETFLIDWADLEAGRLQLAFGTLGKVEHTAEAFSAELRGPTAALEASPIELFSPECRAVFGDRRCRANLALYTHHRQAAEAVAPDQVDFAPAFPNPEHLRYGRLRVLTGAAAGETRKIESATGSSLFVSERIDTLAAGDVLELREGCDKRFETCANRFRNALNFRGEPHVPGADAVMRYPGLG